MFARLRAAYVELIAELRAFTAALRRQREEFEADAQAEIAADEDTAVLNGQTVTRRHRQRAAH
jgi:hypothetical protein